MEVLMDERANLFDNKVIDGTAIKRLISRLIDHFGTAYTSHILDQVKTLGFQQATATSISLGIDDLLTVSSKGWLVQDIEHQSLLLANHQHYGNVHAIEKLRQSIDIWYATSEYLRQEMNPNFRMTEPSNPAYIMSFSGARGSASQIHQLVGMRGLMSDPQGQMLELVIQSNLREGLSLTEYIISCYGARKGVIDTSVRTSDAGYLTRRLVEVVQHLVVRRTDCGTTRGIHVSPPNGMMPQRVFINTLVGRVLADNIYIGPRCIALRNQDIGVGLIHRFIIFQRQAISIRTPFTCKSTSWICRLCYGRSPTQGDLVELGEAVGIIAGQSIGEPGTQLTLRTFHTGGVFTGATAEYLRAPSNGKIKFNEDLVHPIRTRYGQPAFLCYRDLYVSIESEDSLHNVTLPPKSLLLVQNGQYVESEQLLAEFREETYTFRFTEKVEKHTYSESGGELHWSTDIDHTSAFPSNNVRLLPKASHLWILAGRSSRPSIVPFSLHKDQDQMSAHSLSVEKRFISKSSVNSGKNDQVQHKLVSSDLSTKKESEISSFSELNRIKSIGQSNLIYLATRHQNFDLLTKRVRNRFLIPFQSIQESEKEEISRSDLLIEIPINGIFYRNSIFAYFDDPQYRVKSSRGILKYEAVGEHSIVDRFFFIPMEVDILPHSSTLIVRNKSIIGIDTPITLTRRSQIGGLAQVEEEEEEEEWGEWGEVEQEEKQMELEIFAGDLFFLEKRYKISQNNDIKISRGTVKRNSNESKKRKKRIYVEEIAPTRKGYFALVQPVILYQIADGINFETLFLPDLLREKENLKLQVANYILYGNNREIDDRSIQLVRTCLVLNWDQDKKSSSIEGARTSFVEVSTIGLIRDFLQIKTESSISYPYINRKRTDPLGFGSISPNGSDYLNMNSFFSIYSKAKIQQSLKQNQVTLSTFLNTNRNSDRKRNKKAESLIILSSSNCFQIHPLNNGKYHNDHNVTKELTKKELQIPIRNLLGSLGTALEISNIYSIYHYLLTHNQISVTKYLKLGNLKKTFQALPYYLMEENKRIWNPDSSINRVLNPFHLNWYFLHQNYHHNYHSNLDQERFTIMNLGQLIFENGCMPKNVSHPKSGQVIIIHLESLVLRSAKPYLVTPGSTIYGNYGERLYKGHRLATFLYEKSRSDDITQGLPKVEKMFEVRSTDSLVIKLNKKMESWNASTRRILGIPWRFLLSAELTMAQSRISLVNKIQKIYLSQGVQIQNRHIEIIVRQITSKVSVSEDGMSPLFLPGELIELLRAERIGRAMKEVICYRAMLLGITRASLNTQSFISEASFQETSRVLAKAALRGRIDWLKGLKENVVLSSRIPAGTGFNGSMDRSRQDKSIPFQFKRKKNLFEGEMRDIFFDHIEFFDSSLSKNFDDRSEQELLGFHDCEE